jgi:predicted dehydrogenase
MAFERIWNVPTFRTVESLLAHTSPGFAVLSVPRTEAPNLIVRLASQGLPVLAETPPAQDLDALNRLYAEVGHDAQVQVAEQYLYQPLHAARLAIAKAGTLGTVSQAQVSVAHGYHGVSLIRQFLNAGLDEEVRIRAFRFTSPIVRGPSRAGDPAEHQIGSSDQVIAYLEFKDRLGVFDFTGDQYFSWIRSPRLLVRGDKGEISGNYVRALMDFRTPYELELRRMNAGVDGNLEGFHLKGIMAGDQWVYRNPVQPGRLSDDEIAIATCLLKMGEYVQGGPAFYSLAEAAHDHYLSLLIDASVRSGDAAVSSAQSWSGR